jgi:hypothetical protein
MLSPAQVRNRVLDVSVGGRRIRDLLYPAYVRLYPWLFRPRHFLYDGQRYRYMFHPYGSTLRSERLVEIPIAVGEMNAHAGKRILEVGNVLSHYGSGSHVVLDKYERGDRCLNVDVMDYRPEGRFDLIVSISTVEHIGWNEHERDPGKAERALQRMHAMLEPGGTMLVTIPWGYHPALDRYVRSGECLFERLRYLKRISRRNVWVQCDAGALAEARYGSPYPFANALVIGYARGR